MDTLLVIDGNNITHRFFHTPSRRPPADLLGFEIGRLLRKYQPDRAVVAWDSKGTTWRRELFSGYKANRKELDADKVARLDAFFVEAYGLFYAAGIQQTAQPGEEADDIIAGYVDLARDHEYRSAIIVSNDKDLLQLVTGAGARTQVGMLSGTGFWRAAETIAKWGVCPHHIPDVLALAGDSSDGYPGLQGVGPKTAAKLIAACIEYRFAPGLRSLLDILEILDGSEAEASKQLLTELTAIVGKGLLAKIRNNIPQLRLYYKLARLRPTRGLSLPDDRPLAGSGHG